MMHIQNKKLILIALIGLLLSNPVGAQNENNTTFLSAFTKVKSVSEINIQVPTVVEVPLTGEVIERTQFAIYNKTTDSFEPYLYRNITKNNALPVSASASTGNNVFAIIDNNLKTSAEFTLPENNQGSVELTILRNSPITSSRLTLILDDHVALPNTISIKTNKTIVAPKRMTSQTINFPETTSSSWSINLAYSQLLRISELRLEEKNPETKEAEWIRFLAQPKEEYRIYFNPDRSVAIQTSEQGNLTNDKDVIKIGSEKSTNNNLYIKADIDNDGIPDKNDNCVRDANPNQEDVNNNGRGDICDDFDRDGIQNQKDNCPNEPNSRQIDTDGDKKGDACDDEESRLTEKYKWFPWIGIGIAVIVIIFLFARTFHEMKKEKEEVEPQKNENDQPQ